VRRVSKIRQNLYIDQEIGDALAAIAVRHRGNKSQLVNDALRSWLRHRGAREVDTQFGMRLDQISREIAAGRRDIDLLIESLALFIRYELMATPPLAEDDHAGRIQGRQRFEAFITQVARQVASGKRGLVPVSSDGSPSDGVPRHEAPQDDGDPS
jgi:hypothetical protein